MEKYTFLEIFSKAIQLENNKTTKIERIEIPRIQRDYAQGRVSVLKKGEMDEKGHRFIKYLFKSLKEGKDVELDFVYGEIHDNVLIPLDGQQRLTTLFLLHWYLGTFELDGTDITKLKNVLVNFTYETRKSSSDFCKSLVKTINSEKSYKTLYENYCTKIDNDIEDLTNSLSMLKDELTVLKNDNTLPEVEKKQKILSKKRDLSSADYRFQDSQKSLDNKKKLSSFIKNESWYFNSYDNDPTIISMLNMLDKINELYKHTNTKIYQNLSKLRFSILPLEHIYQPEELYIKMNARGKQLTNFENFKADLIGWMINKENPEVEKFNPSDKSKYVTYGRRNTKMAFYQRFSNLIDNEWTDILWNITKHYDPDLKEKNVLKYPNGKLVDPLFLPLFYRYFLYLKIEKSDFCNTRDIIDNDEFFNDLLDEKEYVKFDDIGNLLNFSKIEIFEKIMNQIHEHKEEIFKLSNPSWETKPDARNLFEPGITYQGRVVLYAIFKYLERNKFDKTEFSRWIRTIWNIVQNTDIDNIYGTISCLNVVNILSDNSERIYDYLNTDNYNFSSSQVAIDEERLKSQFIIKDHNWESRFIAAESHSYFKGSIRFLISNDMTMDVFENRFNSSKILFVNKGIDEKYRKDHIWLRCIISNIDTFNNLCSMKLLDLDEHDPQHYLKQMLRKDYIIKPLQNLLDNTTVDDIDNYIAGQINKNSSFQGEEKRIHELLYKTPELENWMQNENDPGYRRVTIKKNGNYYFVFKELAWRENYRDYLMVETYRNDIIRFLIENKQCEIDNSKKMSVANKYYCGYSIDVKRTGITGNFVYKFDHEGTVKVGQLIDNNLDESKPIHIYSYTDVTKEEQIPGFVEQIEKDVFSAK